MSQYKMLYQVKIQFLFKLQSVRNKQLFYCFIYLTLIKKMEKPIPDINENIKEISSVQVLFASFVIHKSRIKLVKMTYHILVLYMLFILIRIISMTLANFSKIFSIFSFASIPSPRFSMSFSSFMIRFCCK